MLKLRAPIKLSLRNDLFASKEEFGERIRGNYSYMGSELNEADLLHITTQPPEVYLMGGGVSSMVNNANIENTQIQKVNVINNLINRILISADAKLSYQDSVYISSVLHKMGIKDDRKFMSEVRRLTRQTKQLNDVTQLYWNNVEELREMINEYAGDMRLEFKSENEVINNSVLHLHELVNRRLKTAAIYQIMRNYYENDEGDKSITNAEFKISEQGRFAKEVLLNRLRETVRMEAQPLVYRHENIYEGDETNVENMSVSRLNERVNSAVLMNLIDNIYELSYERMDHHIRNWISTEDSYYGASDNVLYRFEQNTAYLQYLHEEYIKNIDKNDQYLTEMESLKQLIEIKNNIDNGFIQNIGGSYTDSRNFDTSLYEGDVINRREGDSFVSADMEFVTYGDNNEQRLYTDERYREGDTYRTQNTDVNINNINITNVSAQTGANGEVQKDSDAAGSLTLINREIRNEGDTNIALHEGSRREGDRLYTDDSVSLTQNNINIDNVVRKAEQMAAAESAAGVELTHISTSVTNEGDTNIELHEETRREGDRLYTDDSIHLTQNGINTVNALSADRLKPLPEGMPDVSLTHISNRTEHGGDVNISSSEQTIHEGDRLYTDGSVHLSEERNVYVQEAVKGAGVFTPAAEGSREPADITYVTNEGGVDSHTDVTNETRQINEALYQTYQQNIARNRRYMQNLKNIIEANAPESTGLTPAQRTMQAAAMALNDPGRVIEQYTESELRERERLETIRRESEKLLHPLQQRAHQLIREYLSAPERFYMSERISRDDMGVLLHDIYHVAEGASGAEPGTADSDIRPVEAKENGVNEAALYPPSSDTRARGSAYTQSERLSADAGKQTVYESLELRNIYPVYNISAESEDRPFTIENIAGNIRSHTVALKEAAKENEVSREVLEHILREESVSEREFTTALTQREVTQGREVMVRHQNETVSHLLENVVNRWARRQLSAPEPVYSYEDEKLSFVHKSTENTVDEETIENIRQEMLRMEQTQRSINEHTQNLIREEKTVVNNVNHQTIEQNSEDIQRVVNRSVREQLDSITEKVYGRIERQLKNEQRRRGL